MKTYFTKKGTGVQVSLKISIYLLAKYLMYLLEYETNLLHIFLIKNVIKTDLANECAH